MLRWSAPDVKPGLLITWLIVLALAGGFVDAEGSLPAPSGILNPKVPLEAPEVGRDGGTPGVGPPGRPRTLHPIVAQDGSPPHVPRPTLHGAVEENYHSGET